MTQLTDESRERLLQLKRVIEAAPAELFDMETITDKSGECGTTHCAFGWAMVDPWFTENTRIGEPDMGFQDSPGVFGLGSDDAYALFNSWKENTGTPAKQNVIDNIDRILDGLPALYLGEGEGGDTDEDDDDWDMDLDDEDEELDDPEDDEDDDDSEAE